MSRGSRGSPQRRTLGAPPPVPAAPGRVAAAVAARSAEREELATLNDRFAAFLERVRALERQNGALRAALGRAAAAAAPGATGLVRGELRGLRERLQRLGQDRDRLQAERDGLAADLTALRRRLEDETQKREDAEKNLVLFRKDVDDATLSRLELERKVELLMDEIGFLKKLHEEELRDLEVSGPGAAGPVEAEVCKAELTAALREIRSQYESIAVKNLQEAEDWYKSKFADLSDAANRNHEALRLAKQEMNESRRQIQSLTCEVDGLKSMNEALQRQMREMEDEFGEEIGNYQDVVGRLEQEIQQLKEEMSRHLREYQDLLNVKMALDIEIATYRKLLEGEEGRITTPPHPATSFSMRSSGYRQPLGAPEPAESPARRMVLIKTIETRDGQQVVTESHKEREEPGKLIPHLSPTGWANRRRTLALLRSLIGRFWAALRYGGVSEPVAGPGPGADGGTSAWLPPWCRRFPSHSSRCHRVQGIGGVGGGQHGRGEWDRERAKDPLTGHARCEGTGGGAQARGTRRVLGDADTGRRAPAAERRSGRRERGRQERGSSDAEAPPRFLGRSPRFFLPYPPPPPGATRTLTHRGTGWGDATNTAQGISD
ncbi:peripherin [Indicator indicator]|uniref:peripherin n=1 Tax=Indicator indicator TaxID=1002788 RepID=UPI0023DF1770|nr:peripherin [Indicator indicator]